MMRRRGRGVLVAVTLLAAAALLAAVALFLGLLTVPVSRRVVVPRATVALALRVRGVVLAATARLRIVVGFASSPSAVAVALG